MSQPQPSSSSIIQGDAHFSVVSWLSFGEMIIYFPPEFTCGPKESKYGFICKLILFNLLRSLYVIGLSVNNVGPTSYYDVGPSSYNTTSDQRRNATAARRLCRRRANEQPLSGPTSAGRHKPLSFPTCCRRRAEVSWLTGYVFIGKITVI